MKIANLDWYGFRIIKLGVALNTFGDLDFQKKADIIGVEGMLSGIINPKQ